MNQITPQILTKRVRKGELYLCATPEAKLGFGKRVYIKDDKSPAGGPDYPVEGIVFNVEGQGDVTVFYTPRGQTQDSPNIRRFALKEKDTYCAAFR